MSYGSFCLFKQVLSDAASLMVSPYGKPVQIGTVLSAGNWALAGISKSNIPAVFCKKKEVTACDTLVEVLLHQLDGNAGLCPGENTCGLYNLPDCLVCPTILPGMTSWIMRSMNMG